MPGKAEHLGTTSDGRQLVRLLCAVQTSAEDGDGKIHLIPGGPVVVARDDRMFQVTDLNAVIAASEIERGLLVDWEHDSEKWDGSTKAAGWITALEMSDGSERAAGLWGTVKWTKAGKADVDDLSYRFLSPVLLIDSESRAVQQVVSVALTNKPALRMEQIGKFRERLSAQFGPLTVDREENSMSPEKRKALCAAFSLAETASDDEILAAATAAKGGAASTRELLSVTQGQLTNANARVTQLETDLAAAKQVGEQSNLEREVAALFAANKNKVSPAQYVAFHAFCVKSRANFDTFRNDMLPGFPVIGELAPPSITAPTTTTEAASLSVSDKERALFRKRGMTDAQVDAAVKHAAEQRAKRFEDEED